MDRPMRDMLKRASPRLSLHMPGCQGKGPFGRLDAYRFDTTELSVTDDLYRPTGPIARAQALAAASAGMAHTLLLHGGSTAGMHAMLAYAAHRGECVILPRHTHTSALNACALLGVQPIFVKPSFTEGGLPYTPLDAYLHAMEEHPGAKAVLMVRPDYYGLVGDAQPVADAAHARGMLFFCDEAHGAHWNWFEDIPNAGACGADLFVQSAHKTLPALTAGAWLHAAAGIDNERLRGILRMVQTSSPSFISMMALDDARAWMDEHGALACMRLKAAMEAFAEKAEALGYEYGPCAFPYGFSGDPLRLVLRAPQGGYALSQQLAELGIDVEMADERRIVCILSLMDGPKRLDRLWRALRRIGMSILPTNRAEGPLGTMPTELPVRAMPLSEAMFAKNEGVALSQAVGRICAVQVGLYPPGVALLTAGERIDQAWADYLQTLNPNAVFGLLPPNRLPCVTLGATANE